MDDVGEWQPPAGHHYPSTTQPHLSTQVMSLKYYNKLVNHQLTNSSPDYQDSQQHTSSYSL